MIAAPACGGTNDEPRVASPASPAPSTVRVPTATAHSCPPASASLEITAKGLAFDKECLTAPANEPFTIRFTNADGGVPHNIGVHTQTLAETFLKGKIVTGVARTIYRVKALAAGTYLFHCDLHPNRMNGTLLVGG
jgi:plastocyanin